MNLTGHYGDNNHKKGINMRELLFSFLYQNFAIYKVNELLKVHKDKDPLTVWLTVIWDNMDLVYVNNTAVYMVIVGRLSI